MEVFFYLNVDFIATWTELNKSHHQLEAVSSLLSFLTVSKAFYIVFTPPCFPCKLCARCQPPSSPIEAPHLKRTKTVLRVTWGSSFREAALVPSPEHLGDAIHLALVLCQLFTVLITSLYASLHQSSLFPFYIASYGPAAYPKELYFFTFFFFLCVKSSAGKWSEHAQWTSWLLPGCMPEGTA